MLTVYVYVLDTLADWELGHVMSELNSRRFFKKDAPRITLKTIGASSEPITTMGGLTIAPSCTVDDLVVSETSMLLLPGADRWSELQHQAIVEKAREQLAAGGTVCGICGATVALAQAGLLDTRSHTSNGSGFLDMFAPAYQGQGHYVDEPSVSDGNLMTASCTGALLWTKYIIERADVFQPNTLEAWYQYFSTGKPEHFFALAQTLPANDED